MTLPIRTLPILEQWDCHLCGICCKGHTVFLDDEDRRRIVEQRWDQHPGFSGLPVIRRLGWLRPEHVLEQRSDGSCVFLSPEGYCLIHKEHGEAAKPWACRMFPFQLIPVDDHARMTMRRNCPSAAANSGKPLATHLPAVRALAPHVLPERQIRPPAIRAGIRRGWADTLIVTEVLERIMLDERFPLLIRVLRGLRFCSLLGSVRIARLDGAKLRELVRVLEVSADDANAKPAPPGRVARMVFRQIAAEYARFHPNLGDRPGWSERARLFWSALRIATGTGRIPRIHPSLPDRQFPDLEEPLGPLPEPVMTPVRSYFEAATASMQYCGAGRFGWSVVDGFRALAAAYPVAMWLMRWISAGQPPTLQNSIDVVCMIDRSHYYPLLGGMRHRQRLGLLAFTSELDRLVSWYAR